MKPPAAVSLPPHPASLTGGLAAASDGVSGAISPTEFFSGLYWLDGRPLPETIEPYRRRIFDSVLWTFDDQGVPVYNLALCGRGKKNWKTADLILAALYRLLVWPSHKGSDCFVLANDEGQAADDLALAKKLIGANPDLEEEVNVFNKEIGRKDGCGVLRILPARDVAGAHGKTYSFCGFDEIHGYRDHGLFEALAPDPSRPDALIWITSYAGIRHAPGIPLYDFQQTGKRGDDPRMFFSWYSGDFSTDESIPEDASPEERANPSLASWGNAGYLAQQKKRLPAHKYRRLHLNLPGAPDGAALNADNIMASVAHGRKRLHREDHIRYLGYVDMSGGSNDEAVLAIAHWDDERKVSILDSVMSQAGEPPFDPRAAIRKFSTELLEYGCNTVLGDSYAGQTFPQDFERCGIKYSTARPFKSASEAYELFEPRLNAGGVELLDSPKLIEQLLNLVWRGGKIDHQVGDHDDWSNAACGALVCASKEELAPQSWNPPEILTVPGGVFTSAICGGGSMEKPGGWPSGSVQAAGVSGTLGWTPNMGKISAGKKA